MQQTMVQLCYCLLQHHWPAFLHALTCTGSLISCSVSHRWEAEYRLLPDERPLIEAALRELVRRSSDRLSNSVARLEYVLPFCTLMCSGFCLET